MPQEQDPPAASLASLALGDEVPGPLEAVGQRHPPHREAQPAELVGEGLTDRADAVEVVGAAVDVHHPLEQREVGGLVPRNPARDGPLLGGQGLGARGGRE
jgi:hypothetical protein